MLPSSTNIVIIGGGVLGTSAAFQLAKDGHQDILLLDRGPLANGTTPFAAGQTAYLSASPDRLPLTNYCLDFLENFAERTGYPIDFKQHGSLRIALTEAYLPELEAHQVAADGLGHELKSLTQKDFSNKRKSKTGKYFEYIGSENLPESLGDKDLLLINAMESAMEEGYSNEYNKIIRNYFLKLQNDE